MNKDKPKDYKTLYLELEEVIEALQSADADLESATRHYEKGINLIAELEEQLKNSEIKITKIKAGLKSK